VIFDMDGTLLDTERVAGQAWLLGAQKLGLAFDPALVMQMVGHNTPDCTAMIVARHGPAFPVSALMEATHAAFDEELARDGIALRPGVFPLIDWLSARDIPLAVATSTRRERAAAQLARTGILPRLAVLVGGDEVAHGKPAPDIYVAAAARLDVPASACLAIEDSAAGYRSAHAAGMEVVLVPDQVDASAALAALAPRVLPSLAAVQRWLAGDGGPAARAA
jgi:HAD superfamily hydrolase (TIGR01509 family)